MLTVVIRDEKAKESVVWRVSDLKALRKKLSQKAKADSKQSWVWLAGDAFILKHYNSGMGASWIAAELSAKRRRKITKNMVVSRAHALKRAGFAVQRRSRPVTIKRNRLQTALNVPERG